MARLFDLNHWLSNWRLPKADATIVLAPVVGIVAGLGAIVFHLLCLLVTHYALVGGAGYDQQGPANEAGFADVFPQLAAAHQSAPSHESTDAESPRPAVTWWMLILVPTVGGLVSAAIVYTLAPETAGGGTDAAIHSYHYKRGLIRLVVPPVKLISAAITIGTGGSGGREGPISQIGAGCGSFIATRMKLTDHQRRVLMCSGIGAGIGAIFHAPLAGAFFATEVLYRDPDFESDALIPGFIATVIAYCVFCLAFGFKTLFEVEQIPFNEPALLLPLGGLALTMAVASLIMVRCYHGVTQAFKLLPISRFLKPAIGAMLTGVTGVALYFALVPFGDRVRFGALSVMSFGYGFLQSVLAGEIPTDMTAALLLMGAVGLGKILTTSLTLGSGGSGGEFGPSMVIGGSLGGVVGAAFHGLMPGLVSFSDIRMFTILGMAGFLTAAAKTPITALIIVSELTGSYSMLLPSMWVCALAYLLSRRWTIYHEQVVSRVDSPAHRGDFIVDVLEGLTVRDAMSQMNRHFVAATLDMPLGDMAKLITDTRQTSFPVMDSEGRYYGLFGINDIRQFLYDSPLAALAVAQDLATANEPLTLQMDLSSAMGLFAQSKFDELPVVDAEKPDSIIGLLRRQDVIASYSARLLAMRGDGQVDLPRR